MKTKTMTAFLILAATAMTTAACFRSYGHRRYPGTPRFASNDYAYVQLLRREPRRDHVRLGEVWFRPEPWMDRYEVKLILREKTARMGGDALIIVADRYPRGAAARRYRSRAVGERWIIGFVIRYRR
ncbi:MAG: hypothetical protein PHF93_00010 [Acidobacteriota bacterium]|nr:hypothetical protein [Acidobacteriota bacterium]OQB56120.1 MAG: hypothetical protein BWX98_01888 [Candidatus Aminicenantes bacterium ADurb.Bin147]HNT32208.1 hypothetical protein [Candidatus Aminicenantes bacterium]MDD8010994.1 hypothetical protein [Acidobacteriota bacterium]MDD8029529.1 hypothetical protein [Acidobacteriota bacterium]